MYIEACSSTVNENHEYNITYCRWRFEIHERVFYCYYICTRTTVKIIQEDLEFVTTIEKLTLSARVPESQKLKMVG